MIEVLLVLVVISITALAVVPMMTESIAGTQMRTAMRDVIALNHYARSRAILDQKSILLLYDSEAQVLELVLLPARGERSPQSIIEPPLLPESEFDLSSIPEEASDFEVIRKRSLRDAIVIEHVEGLPQEKGVWFAIYTPSGMCDPHSIQIRDRFDRIQTIHVQGFTGDVRIGEAL